MGRGAVILVAAALALAACHHVESGQVCAIEESYTKASAFIGGFEGLDLLIVVDDSGSMAEEQQILAGAVIDLINALVDPPQVWPYSAADDVRVAVVSSNMGLHPLEDSTPPWEQSPEPTPCSGLGDDGEFRSYAPGKTIEIGGEELSCPALGEVWAQTDELEPNPDLALQAACLTSLGTNGCGIEQQLKSAERGLSRDDQSGFIRYDSLLAVLVISDEEDCSIESAELFAEDEIQDLAAGEINLACGRHPEHLFDPQHFYERLVEIKGYGSVAFAAIVGVPPGNDDGLGACEGPGHGLDECLDQPDMQLVEVQENNAWFHRPACERYEGDELVTKARPGRRYVELAQEFQSLGYVYSICRDDWTPAVEDFAKLIADHLCGQCFPKPLPWDPETHTATCDLWVQYADEAACPTGLVPADEIPFTDADGFEHTLLYCELPKIAAPLDCAAAEQADTCTAGIGWYYCENMSAESFNETCEDGLDNDGDGAVDCDDDGCQPCAVCGGTGVGCEKKCKYNVRLTEEARALVWGQQLSVVCAKLSASDDPNCWENTHAVCNDGVDNNDNGVWDCEAILTGEDRHGADFECCPMHVDDENRCVVDPEAFEICAMTPDEPSDACVDHARLLQCVPTWD